MLHDFLPHAPRPRSWFAAERSELSAMGRPARFGTAALAVLLAAQRRTIWTATVPPRS